MAAQKLTVALERIERPIFIIRGQRIMLDAVLRCQFDTSRRAGLRDIERSDINLIKQRGVN